MFPWLYLILAAFSHVAITALITHALVAAVNSVRTRLALSLATNVCHAAMRASVN